MTYDARVTRPQKPMQPVPSQLCPAMASQHITKPASTKAKYVHRLDTPQGVRKELAALYAEARRGTVDSTDAYRLSLMLGQLAKVMEVADLADRLDALETASASHLRRLA